jgi:glucose/arabinose dehydrogenase
MPTSTPSLSFSLRSLIHLHSGGNVTGCAITGGAFYNPTTIQFPASYVGKYFFSDLCSGWIKTVDPAHGFAVADFASGISSPVKIRVGPTGSLYYLAGAGGSSGAVYRIDASASSGWIRKAQREIQGVQ